MEVIMKKATKTTILFLTGFLLCACAVCIRVKKPKDVKPIDWENYNSAYDVFWNFHLCSDDVEDWGMEERIKVYGWLHKSDSGLGRYYLNRSTQPGGTGLYINILPKDEIERKRLDSLLRSIDYPKQCYIQGVLFLTSYAVERSFPEIMVERAEDIHFDEQ